MEDTLLAWIRASRNRHFLLIIAGRLSGIHDWKRTHIPVAYQVMDTTVVIHFDGSERLTISDAVDIVSQSNGELFVRDASEVRFSWYSGKDPGKDCEEIFTKFGRMFTFSRTDDLCTTAMAFGHFNGKLVELR